MGWLRRCWVCRQNSQQADWQSSSEQDSGLGKSSCLARRNNGASLGWLGSWKLKTTAKGFMVWNGFNVIVHVLYMVHSVCDCVVIVAASVTRPSGRNSVALCVFDKTTLQSDWFIFEKLNIFMRAIIKGPNADPWCARWQGLQDFEYVACCRQSAFLRGLIQIRHGNISTMTVTTWPSSSLSWLIKWHRKLAFPKIITPPCVLMADPAGPVKHAVVMLIDTSMK